MRTIAFELISVPATYTIDVYKLSDEDLIPQKGLTDKTIIPIEVGGTLHHLLVIDYALKPVLSSLNTRTILQGVYVLDKQISRTDSGFEIEREILERIDVQLE